MSKNKDSGRTDFIIALIVLVIFLGIPLYFWIDSEEFEYGPIGKVGMAILAVVFIIWGANYIKEK